MDEILETTKRIAKLGDRCLVKGRSNKIAPLRSLASSQFDWMHRNLHAFEMKKKMFLFASVSNLFLATAPLHLLHLASSFLCSLASKKCHSASFSVHTPVLWDRTSLQLCTLAISSLTTPRNTFLAAEKVGTRRSSDIRRKISWDHKACVKVLQSSLTLCWRRAFQYHVSREFPSLLALTS